MTPQTLRVIKVGGSLLGHRPDEQAKGSAASEQSSPCHQGWQRFPWALKSWLSQQTPDVNVLVAGGGERAEAIRRSDAAHGLGEEAAHWLCVDALSLNAQLLGAIAQLPVVTRPEDIPAELPSACVFDPAPFLHDVEYCLFTTPLPHSWAVTSDSIAARIAEYLSARELVLLKSCLPGAATPGYVDDYFSVAAANFPSVRCVNLRSESFEEIPWVSCS